MKNKINTGILFVNLGTPEKLTIYSIRKYLKEFLMDKRVIDLPFFLRFFIVYFFILPFRPYKIIKKYQLIWNKDKNQSPLIIYTDEFIKKLKQIFPSITIDYVMRYGNPSIKTKMEEFYQKGIRYLHIIPLYPQYATSTYGSVIAEICKINQKFWDPFILSFEPLFYDNPEFISIWVKKIESISEYKNYYILFSFHGIPERHILKSDRYKNCFSNNCCEKLPEFCYKAQSKYLSYQIANRLKIKHFGIAYQSRLGKAKWLEPYLEDHLKEIIKNHKKILIVPLSFTTDCLETLEELNISTKEFVHKIDPSIEIQVLTTLNNKEEWIEFWKKRIENFFIR